MLKTAIKNQEKTLFIIAIALASILPIACSRSVENGPDKTVGGALLGAGWGAGAGWIVGHQLGYPGEGAAIGSGFGFVHGALTGLGMDLAEDEIFNQERLLASIKVKNGANARQLALIQRKLDGSLRSDLGSGIYQVFFDPDATSMRGGSIANLEVLAEHLKSGYTSQTINVVGHSDDSGDPAYNRKLADARARSVAGYLSSRGISSDRIKILSYGAERPIASNNTQTGRQLNRRVDVYVGK
ncbi:MAG TPA: OmpA family protein [Oligoflexia bacterium]|nr:OmpA family protein [Oligoflexia bacterium]HMP27785.1 OmpA family protein [Oligoflexia bacterium]